MLHKDKQKIELILEWAKKYSEFDLTFVEFMGKELRQRGSLTTRQSVALDNIINTFKISEQAADTLLGEKDGNG